MTSAEMEIADAYARAEIRKVIAETRPSRTGSNVASFLTGAGLMTATTAITISIAMLLQ